MQTVSLRPALMTHLGNGLRSFEERRVFSVWRSGYFRDIPDVVMNKTRRRRSNYNPSASGYLGISHATVKYGSKIKRYNQCEIRVNRRLPVAS